MKHIYVLLTLALLASCKSEPELALPTVPSVDTGRYMGNWYEIALLPNRFQAMCVSDTMATYSLEGEKVKVKNRCRRSDGKVEEANGTAKVVDGSGNAKLRVSFFWPFYGNYWILALDPDYRWVLIGEPSREYGWILARSPHLDDATLAMILDKAESLGYSRTSFKPSRQIKALD